jgi:hypothetical protein
LWEVSRGRFFDAQALRGRLSPGGAERPTS